MTLAPARLTALAEACAADSPAILAAQRAHKHAKRVAVVFPAGNTYDPDWPGTPLEQHDRAMLRIVAWAEHKEPKP